MTLLKRLSQCLAGACMALSILIAPAMAQEVKTLRVLTSPSGSGPYNTWAVIQTNMEKFSPWLRLQVEETPGFTYNVQYMSRRDSGWQESVWGAGTVLNWAAANGVKPFFRDPAAAVADFRTLAVFGLSYNVWVSLDESIKTPADFVGRSVGIGLLTQNEWGMHPRMILDGLGLTQQLRSLDTLGTGPNIQAMLDGRTDVGTLFGLTSAGREHTVVTGPHRQLEASNRRWHYVNVPPEVIEAHIEKTGAPFEVVSYPPNTLPNQPEPITTFGDLLVLQAHKSLPDDMAYELTRVMVEHYEDIAKLSAFARAWTPETLAYHAQEHPDQFHPGALRAYKDLGLIE